jgi:periplasmic divalent cation tolerance protein
MIIITTSTKSEAKRIVNNLLTKKLIACGNIIGPIYSSYWWNNEIEQNEEFLILAKSKKMFYKRVEKKVLQLHSYETPEILVLPIIDGSRSYLDWILNSVNSDN